MSSFDGVLREIDSRLDLPVKARRQVLLDLAADLDGLKRAALDTGLDEDAAEARALEFVDVSDEAISALARELAAAPRRWLESFSGVARSRGERVALALVAIAIVQLGAALFANGALVPSAGSAAWLSIGVLFISLILGAYNAYRFRIVGDERTAPLLRGASWAWRLCALQLGIGMFKLVTGVATAWTLLDTAPTRAFAIGSGPGLSPGLREHLLLLQDQTALLSLVGLGALTAGLLAQRLASHSYQLRALEQQLHVDLSTSTQDAISCSK